MNGNPDRFTTKPDPAVAGEDLEICFDNPQLAGETITVSISNGEGTGSDSIDIALDEHGHGCKTWTVLATGGDVVQLNEASSGQHTTPVVIAGGGGGR